MVKLKLVMMLLVCQLVLGKYIEIPPVGSNTLIELHHNTLVYLSSGYLEGMLKRVSKKEVYLISGTSRNEPFPICGEDAPMFHFIINDMATIQDNNKYRSFVVYDFEQIQQAHNLIDILMFNDMLYLIVGTGVIYYAPVSKESVDIRKAKLFHTNLTKLYNGQLVMVDGWLLFVNYMNIVGLDLKSNGTVEYLAEFKHKGELEVVVALGTNHFAVGFGTDGLEIYSFAEGKLGVKLTLNANSLNLTRINVVDLAYDTHRKLLFVLYEYFGIIVYYTSIYNGTMTISRLSTAVRKKSCTNMHFDPLSNSIYLLCRYLYKINIGKWPILAEKILHRPSISVKSIISLDKLVAFVGNNAFYVSYLYRKSYIRLDALLDKLILAYKLFLSANYDSIIVGYYTVHPPRIYCINDYSIPPGNYYLLIKTTAECNKYYLSSIDYPLSKIYDDDVCVYTLQQEVLLWKQAQINFTLFYLLFGGFVVICISVAIWFVVTSLKLKRMSKELQDYYRMTTGSTSQRDDRPHMELVEYKYGQNEGSYNDYNMKESLEIINPQNHVLEISDHQETEGKEKVNFKRVPKVPSYMHSIE